LATRAITPSAIAGVGSELRPARASAYAVLGAAALIAAAALLA